MGKKYEFEWSMNTVEPNYFHQSCHAYNVQYICYYLPNYWNHKLILDGKVMLNDVLKYIGLSKFVNKDFDNIGWCTKELNNNCDGFIDFGFDKPTELTIDRKMWRDATPEMEEMFKKDPTTDKVILSFNCTNISDKE